MLSESLIKTCKERMKAYPCEGFILGKGTENPRVMFVGEAPGETEINNDIPFSGRAGEEFNKFLNHIGLNREEVFITSAVRSRPYKWGSSRGKKRKYNRTPNQKEIAAHAPILDAEIKAANPELLVPMGRIAYWRLLGEHPRMDEVTGTFIHSPIRELVDWEKNNYRFTEKTFALFPIYHPAAILYKRSLSTDIYHHLDRLKSYLQK